MYLAPTLVHVKRAPEVRIGFEPLEHAEPGFGAPDADTGVKISVMTSNAVNHLRTSRAYGLPLPRQ